jgi:hypothetical protein
MAQTKRKHTGKQWKSAAARHVLLETGHPGSVEEAIRLVAEQLLPFPMAAPTHLDSVARVLDAEPETTSTDTEEDTLHDDGLLFFAHTGRTSTQERIEQARQLAERYFKTRKPRGFSRGEELESLKFLLASELLLPTRSFREVVGNAVTMERLLAVAHQFDVSPRLVARKASELPYTAIFEATPEEILWGYGGVRKGLLNNLDPTLRDVIKYILQEAPSEAVHFFSAKRPWFGSRCVEWAQPAMGRTLFLVRLPFKHEANDNKLIYTSDPSN